jgi:hypothetical protein
MGATHRRTIDELCGSPLRRTAPNLVRRCGGDFPVIKSALPNHIQISIFQNPEKPVARCGASVFCAWFTAVRRSICGVIGQAIKRFVGGSAVRRIWFVGSAMQNACCLSLAYDADLECGTGCVAGSAISLSSI